MPTIGRHVNSLTLRHDQMWWN